MSLCAAPLLCLYVHVWLCVLLCCVCSRISRRVMAEQHLHIANARPGYIGSIATALDVPDAVQFAGQRAVQVRSINQQCHPRALHVTRAPGCMT
jgi:hypothetical protein